MRLGLMLAGSRPAQDAVLLAQRAEAAGVAEIWISEDYFERGAFAVAGAVAASTSRARIGIGVVNPWTRHPVLTAMEVAALDELADGRTLLGIGASNRVWMEDRCGIPFTRPLTAVAESVQVLRSALAGQPVDVAGEHFRVRGTQLSFTPSQSVPIYLGAKGRRALELTGQVGDGVLLSLLSSPDYVTWARRRIGTALDTTAYVLAACGDDAAAARDSVRWPLAFYLGVHGDHDITRVAGLDPARAARFREGWLAGKPATDLVGDQLIDTFAVAGDVGRCLLGLKRFHAAGVDCAVLRDPGDDYVEGVLQLIAAYHQRLAPSRSESAGAPA